ncbi:G protein subunit beta Ecym_8317 [Eremothecium cymbalariae DBVPG|uniref:Uncharacterized protein n=1 Tax=Eremothecium cymbalariae (strain CBS 270.75 / DBVPG 7215 / KCTC 17166 / NRRL Y-17582) TaxID=931890 RepID=G8JXM1_ERECY|nr:Hypothetical protein Ecym_8317 [Eremothecium cymbalariae DBVPG\
MNGYSEYAYAPIRHYPKAQELVVCDGAADVQGNIEEQIMLAREECKQLYNQVNKVKSKVQDGDLVTLSKNVGSVGSVNLKPITSLKGHNNKITDFRWSSDSKRVLSASQDGYMLLWDAATGLKRNAIPLNSQWVLTCALCPNGNLSASAGLDNNCTIYRISQHERVQQNIVSIFKGHTCYISDVEFLDDKTVITASGDMTCALWDVTKSRRTHEFSDHLGDVLSISIPPSHLENAGNIFASGGSDGYLYIWDKRTPTSVQSFFVSDSDISKVKFFKNGDTIAVGSDDGCARLYDLRSDCQIAQYSLSKSLQNATTRKPTYFPSSIEYNVHGNSPYSPSARTVESEFMDDQGIVALDFSRSGRLMYASYTDAGCVIWDLVKGEVIGKLDGHSDRISGVLTSPDGLAVCTGSWDTTMKIWTPKYM